MKDEKYWLTCLKEKITDDFFIGHGRGRSLKAKPCVLTCGYLSSPVPNVVPLKVKPKSGLSPNNTTPPPTSLTLGQVYWHQYQSVADSGGGACY